MPATVPEAETDRMPVSRPSTSPRGRRALALAAACLVPLAASGAALGDAIQVHYTAADQAAARREVLRSSDLGAGWTGGPTKPDLTSEMNCTAYEPKQSDLVVTGAAASDFRRTGLDFHSEAHLLRTARMVALDWQRTVTAPRVLGCLREGTAKAVTDPSTRFVSLNRLAFPGVTSRTAAFRALLDVTSGGTTVRVLVDIVAIGKGRSELTLMTTAPYEAHASVIPAEVRLARILAARATA
jgi:hypothetical protein